MKIIILRHGETKENVAGINMGQMHGELTKNGIKQAKKAALILKKAKIDVIFCSDLRRTKETLKEIIKYHRDVPVYYTKELRERHGGVFQGMHSKHMYEAFKSSGMKNYTDFKPKSGESEIEVKRRVGRLLFKVQKRYKNKTVLILTHGGVARAIHSIYFRKPSFEDMRRIYIPINTGILIINVTKRGPRKITDNLFAKRKIPW